MTPSTALAGSYQTLKELCGEYHTSSKTEAQLPGEKSYLVHYPRRMPEETLLLPHGIPYSSLHPELRIL